jgi:coproporphyrinogen III oxidase
MGVELSECLGAIVGISSQMFQDNLTGAAGKSTTTTMIIPQANPVIPAGEFNYKPPK